MNTKELKFYCDNKRHLICEPYSIENLHVMADLLKINKCWFHNSRHPHYDIPKKRINEISSLCTVISSKELLLKIRAAND